MFPSGSVDVDDTIYSQHVQQRGLVFGVVIALPSMLRLDILNDDVKPACGLGDQIRIRVILANDHRPYDCSFEVESSEVDAL
jgi:hypothetical protein